jgi:hypothetical protein
LSWAVFFAPLALFPRCVDFFGDTWVFFGGGLFFFRHLRFLRVFFAPLEFFLEVGWFFFAPLAFFWKWVCFFFRATCAFWGGWLGPFFPIGRDLLGEPFFVVLWKFKNRQLILFFFLFTWKKLHRMTRFSQTVRFIMRVRYS